MATETNPPEGRAAPAIELNGAPLLGARLRAVRVARYLRVADLATLLGRSASYVTNVESGRRGLSLAALWDWCAFLEVDVGDVVRRPAEAWVGEEVQVVVDPAARTGRPASGGPLRVPPLDPETRQAWLAAERERVAARQERRRRRQEHEAVTRAEQWRVQSERAAEEEMKRSEREREERRGVIERERRRSSW
jgi:transcriptional regulator with XRE-family HTH domain